VMIFIMISVGMWPTINMGVGVETSGSRKREGCHV
jgi:hypothetical protein